MRNNLDLPIFSPVALESFRSTKPASELAWSDTTNRILATLPMGSQNFWGIPFEFGESLILLQQDPVQIPLSGNATHIIVAHFCETSFSAGSTDHKPGQTVITGEHLADYVISWSDDLTSIKPIRRRYEISEIHVAWGELPFAARSHKADRAVDHLGDHKTRAWGENQLSVLQGAYDASEIGTWWLYSMELPHPNANLIEIRMEPRKGPIAIGAITLFTGTANPLRHDPARLYQISNDKLELTSKIDVDIDLGVIGRVIPLRPFDKEKWLASPIKGWGEGAEEQDLSWGGREEEPAQEVAVEIAASPEATLSIEGREYKISDLRVLGERSFFVKGRILDAQTGQPTAARLHVRTAEGIYLPPYGHRHEVNDHWFEDYGADLKLGTTQYAYVDGEFRIELSGSQVFVEVAKGFEYQAIRRSVTVNPDTPFDIYLERSFDTGEGWMSADTHVHFLSPHTALLEAEAEDIHLVNLLASQWGDMFSNMGELGWGEALRKGNRSIWIGTENRQHMLGHISLLGTGENPIMPLAASGPMESTIGDPTWTSLAEWADRCREQGGLVILPHFPYPRVESIADVILGKIDAVELSFFGSEFDSMNFRDWYQLLNVGCRIGCVGGTDKMWAGMPLGGIRTYAYIGDAEVDFPAFSTAVRAGRSLATTGPFIEFSVEGETSGAEIKLPKGGGTLDIEVRVVSSVPFSVIEIVCNGRTICSVEDDRILQFQLPVHDSCWLAARVRGRGKPLPYGIPAPMAIAAHTSPVYITVHDGQLFDSSASIELNAVLEGGLLWLDTLATPAPHGNSTLREVFSMAQIELRKRGS